MDEVDERKMRFIAFIVLLLFACTVPELALGADRTCLSVVTSRGQSSLKTTVRKGPCRTGEIVLPKGTEGDKGDPGAIGATGSSGPTGESGANGPTGVAGATGATGSDGAVGAMGATGVTGAQGSTGTDGGMHVYGDGSAGQLYIDSTTSWVTNPPQHQNLNFTDCYITSNGILTVPSGVVIKCTGDFVLDGEISVQTGGGRGEARASGTVAIGQIPVLSSPTQGISGRAASSGERVVVSNGGVGTGLGGLGGAGYMNATALNGTKLALGMLRGDPVTGGGGAASLGEQTFSYGGFGGGSITIISGGTLTINHSADIDAGGQNGGACSGGGAGGVIFLAAATLVANHGTLAVAGGAGGASADTCAGGGGGSGGVIIYMAPSAPSGTSHTDIDRGTGNGSNVSLISSIYRQGGGGGGGSVGKGGDGGTVPEDSGNTNSDFGEDGATGVVLTMTGDPSTLLIR